MRTREQVRKEAARYIGYINDIIEELKRDVGMTEMRKAVLTRKVIRYKKKIEELKTLWTNPNLL